MQFLSTTPNFARVFLGILALIIFFIVSIKFYFSDANQRRITHNKIKKYFGFLFDHGFKIEETLVNEPNGAWVITLKSEKCKVQITQDRSDVFCELMLVQSSYYKYLDLNTIITSIKKNDDLLSHLQTKRAIDFQLETYGKLLYSNFGLVIEFLENYPKSLVTS